MNNWHILWILMLLSGCANQTDSFDREIKSSNWQTYVTALDDYKNGDFLSAEGKLHQVLREENNHTEANCLLGAISLRTHQYEAAETAYERCLKRQPQTMQHWHHLAVVKLRQATEVLLQSQAFYSGEAPWPHQQLLNRLLVLQRVDTAMFYTDDTHE